MLVVGWMGQREWSGASSGTTACVNHITFFLSPSARISQSVRLDLPKYIRRNLINVIVYL
jgi:hypothetical protein